MQTYFKIKAIGADKRTRTRNALIDSAIEIFAEDGVDDARISRITSLAGLANGTFYNHFKDKDELAAAAALAITTEIAAAQDEAMADVERAATRIVLGTTHFISAAIENRAWAQILVDQYHRVTVLHDATRFVRADIEAGIKQGQFAVTPDDILLKQIGALIIVAIRVALEGKESDALISRTCDSILRLLGLSAKQAAREIARAASALEALRQAS
jgi:AcrR family transcriptional regulator